MAVLGKGSKKKQARKRLERLEKQLGQRIDLDALEKQLGQRIDLKELEKRLPGRKEEPALSSSAGFIAGLVVGAIIGVVLAILFGKGGNREVMDRFAHRAEELKETAAEKYHQVRGEGEEQAGDVAGQFGDDVAIEREVNGEDLVDSATDTIDSASDDVQQAIDEVQEAGEERLDDAQRRLDRA